MKKILYVTLATILILGCEPPKTTSGGTDTSKGDTVAVDTSTANLFNLDSNTDKNTNKSDKDDSLSMLKKYGPSLQVAYGKTNFGMSKKEYHQVMPMEKTKISGTTYFLNPLFMSKENKLYGIELFTSAKTADYIDSDLQDEMDALTKVISSKYGDPETDSGKPDFLDFKPGYIQWVRQWKRANKLIFIGMSELESGSEYSVYCRIIDEDMSDKEDQVSAAKEDKQNTQQSSNF